MLLLGLPLVGWLAWPRRAAGGRRRATALAMRSVILLALTLALSGLTWNLTTDRLDTVFVLDWSASLPDEAKAQAIAYLRAALAEKAPEDRAAVVIFGQDSLVERSLTAENGLGSITSQPIPHGSNLEEALRLALALLPPENARRIIVLTDGAYTGASPLYIASLIRNSGIDLRFVCYPFGAVNDPQECRAPSAGYADAAVTALRLPDVIHRGEIFPLEITLQARGTVTGTLEIRAEDGSLLRRQPCTARTGTERITLLLSAQGESGLQSFTAEFIPKTPDFYLRNNRFQAVTRLQGEPRILVIAPPEGEDLHPFSEEPRPDEAAALMRVLQNTNLQVERALPQGLPFTLKDLSAYAAVVLVDVPAAQLTFRQMSALQRYVRDLGGGLIAVGGPTSFGIGGYFQTPLEEALPVEMQIKDERRRPKLALGYVIDHSGSMMETSSGPTKLQLAQEAAIRSVALLMPGDLVGVVAFDDKASWVVPMQTLEDPVAVQSAITHIGGGGGTDIFAGLLAMSKALPAAEAQIKHIILLTDGGADPTGIPELIQRLYAEENITLTAIGVGADATPALREWARQGGGRYHFVRDPSTLPAIFTTETALVSRSYLVEETFLPLQSAASPLLPPGAPPPLLGYVATEAKRTAQVILQSPREDPILAVWRYGLGKSLAFTSDASGRWGREWLAWEGFAPFWEAAVRSVLGEVQSESLPIEARPEGDTVRLRVQVPESAAPQGAEGWQVRVSVVAPQGEGAAETVALLQSAPRRFEGFFHPGENGVYLLRAEAQPPEGRALVSTAAWVYGYSPEYRPQPAADKFSRLLAALEAPDGSRLLLTAPSRAFQHDLPPAARHVPAAGYLLALAAILLPIEVAVRRLVIGKEDLSRWRAALGERPRLPKSATLSRRSRVRTLLKVKRPPKKPRPSQGSPPPAPPAGSAAPPKAPAPPPREAPPPQRPAAPSSRRTASRLLERKRARRPQKKD